MPVGHRSGFGEEILPRRTHIQRRRAGDRARLAIGPVPRIPHHRLAAVRHPARTIDLVRVDIPEFWRRGIDVGDRREQHVVEPDIFALDGARAGRLRDHPPGAVVDIVRRGGGRLRGADRHPLQAVIAVARGDGRADRQLIEPVPVVVAVVIDGAVAVVGDDVAGIVMRDRPDLGRALLLTTDAVAVVRIKQGLFGRRYAVIEPLVNPVADAVLIVGQFAPVAIGVLQPLARGVDVVLGSPGVVVVPDIGDVEVVVPVAIATVDDRVAALLHDDGVEGVVLRECLPQDQAVAIGQGLQRAERLVGDTGGQGHRGAAAVFLGRNRRHQAGRAAAVADRAA